MVQNMSHLNVLKSQLENWGVSFASASSGHQAFELLAKETDLNFVFVDINLPEVNGIEVARKIRDKYPNLLIVLLSIVGDENKVKYPGLFNSVLTKPVKYDQFLRLVQEQLKGITNGIEIDQKRKSLLPANFGKIFPLNILLARR
ncbi:response regulator [Paradesertivirga mongoliensis]|uniref:Response regulator n=1 Tax=Paradesertivirga mongoliensis TaxID=2100740 RepID=A0ABW4ZLS4_9SPHI